MLSLVNRKETPSQEALRFYLPSYRSQMRRVYELSVRWKLSLAMVRLVVKRTILRTFTHYANTQSNTLQIEHIKEENTI